MIKLYCLTCFVKAYCKSECCTGINYWKMYAIRQFSMHEGSVSGYHVNPVQGRTMKVKEAEPWKLFKKWSITGGSIGFAKWAMIVQCFLNERQSQDLCGKKAKLFFTDINHCNILDNSYYIYYIALTCSFLYEAARKDILWWFWNEALM